MDYKLPNAAAHKITVSSTARGVLAFIDTAASATINYPYDLNFVQIQPEDYAIRYTTDGQIPTANNGILVTVGSKETINAPPIDVRLIRAEATDAVCNVTVGWNSTKS